MLKKKIIALGIVAVSLFSCITASAQTYLTSYLNGTSAESGYVHLGSGTRYSNTRATNGAGTAYAMQIIPLSPDKVMTAATISVPGKTGSPVYDQYAFEAISEYSNGDRQSYYFRWRGKTISSSVQCRFTDSAFE